MHSERIPERWRITEKALKAVQVAFDVSAHVIYAVRKAAFDAELSQPDMIRRILQLPVSRPAKRPRLTVSLSPADYQILGERYGLDPNDALAIKERVLGELVAFAGGDRDGDD